jgi:hypothetical protein
VPPLDLLPRLFLSSLPRNRALRDLYSFLLYLTSTTFFQVYLLADSFTSQTPNLSPPAFAYTNTHSMGETESKSANGAVHATTTSDSSTVAAGQDDQPPIAEPPDLAIEKPILPHTLSAHRVAQDLKSDVDHGLSSEEAASRLARDGPNSIKGAKGISLYEIFIQQVANALTVVLIAVTALSFAISDYIEGAVVAAVIVLNIVVGYVFAASKAHLTSCRLLLLQPHCCCTLLHLCSLFLLPYGEACDFAMRKA